MHEPQKKWLGALLFWLLLSLCGCVSGGLHAGCVSVCLLHRGARLLVWAVAVLAAASCRMRALE